VKNKTSKTIESFKLKNMKKSIIRVAAIIVLALTSQLSMAQNGESNTKLLKESKEALANMIKKSPSLQSYYDKSYGYAVFPKVTKVASSVGGAAGKGIVYKDHLAVSVSKLKQLTFGVQFGGQQYSEVIFFQNKEAFEQFMNKKLKFNGQASAVVLGSGASTDLSYSYGVVVFTQAIGGLMYEASIGGQHFSNEPIED
jgi:lipid-binding SYLF domain-containing protein